MSVSAGPGGVVAVRGNASDAQRLNVATTLRAAVAGAGWAMVDRVFAARDVEALERCLGEDVPWPCLAKAIRDPTIQRVAVANLALGATADGAQLVVITVNVALADPPVSYSRRRFCNPCTADTLTKLTSAAIKEILDLQYLDSGRTYLKVTSMPPGAAVVVDGKPVGVTDLAVEALPGPHRVVITLAGKPPQIRTVEVKDDKPRSWLCRSILRSPGRSRRTLPLAIRMEAISLPLVLPVCSLRRCLRSVPSRWWAGLLRWPPLKINRRACLRRKTTSAAAIETPPLWALLFWPWAP